MLCIYGNKHKCLLPSSPKKCTGLFIAAVFKIFPKPTELLFKSRISNRTMKQLYNQI